MAVIVGPALFTFTFAYFIDSHRGWSIPGAPWYLGAALLSFAIFMSLRIPKLPAHDAAPANAPEPSGEILSAAAPPLD
jgi:hypothetical protein